MLPPGGGSEDSLPDVVVDPTRALGQDRHYAMTQFHQNKVPTSQMGESYVRNGSISDDRVCLQQVRY